MMEKTLDKEKASWPKEVIRNLIEGRVFVEELQGSRRIHPQIRVESTGWSDEVIAVADAATQVKEVKHYYKGALWH